MLTTFAFKNYENIIKNNFRFCFCYCYFFDFFGFFLSLDRKKDAAFKTISTRNYLSVGSNEYFMKTHLNTTTIVFNLKLHCDKCNLKTHVALFKMKTTF